MVKWPEATVLKTQIRLVSIGLAIGQAIAGIYSMFDFITFNVATSMIGMYAILFAALLFFFELSLTATTTCLKRNVGFLYTPIGSTFYLIFNAFLDLGMDNTFGFVVGLLLLVTASAKILLTTFHPTFASVTTPETKTSDLARQVIAAAPPPITADSTIKVVNV